MRIYIDKFFILLATLALFMQSCTDDLDAPTTEEIIEGLPASIAIATDLGNMPVVSRADMTAGKDKEIYSIWLGFFRASDRTLVYQKTYGAQTAIGTPDVDYSTLSNININSGQYFIVAVANPRGNYGVLCRPDGSGNISARTEIITLLENNVTTLDDFLAIAYTHGRTQGTAAIDTPTGNLPMQGFFIPGSGETHPVSSDRVAELTETPVYVAPTTGNTTVPLDGKLHFRRLISQNTFNITYNHDLIKEFKIVRARVYNVPVVSWIAERKDGNTVAVGDGDFDDTNAGDYVSIVGNAASTDELRPKAQSNYLRSPNINTSDISNDGNGKFTFDWWQLENRRSASDGVASYAMREEERKTDEGLNTGVYTALSGASGEVPANNCATYVRLEVSMEMNKNAVGQLGQNSQMTTVDAIYTIHLGYCEGSDESQKLKDYACRRNTKYTYNVHIENVNKIVVEAQKSAEQYEHGAEGIVSFVTTKYFEADAHYAAFNVSLSNVERASAEWILRVYTGQDTYIDIDKNNYKNYPEKYHTWIELRPTTGENVIASYRPYSGDGSDGKTFRLTDIADLTKYPGNNRSTSDKNETAQWYTVFLNEYVYEDGYNSDKSDHWAEYINLPPRSFWLKVQEFRSADYESIIINSKYAFVQKSIQSFYSTTNPVSGIIMGLENINELDGVPLLMHGIDGKGSTPTGGNYGSDARAKNYDYFNVTDNPSPTSWPWNGDRPYGLDYDSDINTFRRWSTYITSSTPMTKNGELNGLLDVRDIGSFTSNYNNGYSFPYYEGRMVGEACLNRNRDLNGDGIIDIDELRWLVPDIDQYVRLVLGSTALTSPLFDFNETPSFNGETDYANKAQYHFGSIGSNQLWAEEGVSTGWLNAGECPNPQQVRCIRYLGNDYGKNPKDDVAFKKAIVKVFGQNRIEFNYTAESIRLNSSGALPVHKVHDAGNWNRPPHHLEYKSTEDDIKISGLIYNNSSIAENATWFEYLGAGNNPCDKFNINGQTGWRVPNQVELLALCYTKNDNDGTILTGHYYATCTRELFSPYRTMGANNDRGFAFNDGHLKGAYIKCVRDVE